MEAKDTVMRDRVWKPMYVKGILCGRVPGKVNIEEDLGAQAEISFNAGIREVVEWGTANGCIWTNDKWQAKLKEWGL